MQYDQVITMYFVRVRIRLLLAIARWNRERRLEWFSAH